VNPLASLLIALLLQALGGPEPQRAPPEPDDGLPPTRFAADVLAGDPLLVEATTLSVTPFGIGTAVVKVRVDQRLMGSEHDVGDEVLVFAYVGHFVTRGRNLLLLEPFGSGGRYQVRMRVDGRDPDYRDKLAMSRAQILLMDVRPRSARIVATLDLLARALDHSSAWYRAYAIREMQWIASERPEVLNAPWLRMLAQMGIRSPHPEVRRGVESVANILASQSDSLLLDDEGQSSTP